MRQEKVPLNPPPNSSGCEDIARELVNTACLLVNYGNPERLETSSYIGGRHREVSDVCGC